MSSASSNAAKKRRPMTKPAMFSPLPARPLPPSALLEPPELGLSGGGAEPSMCVATNSAHSARAPLQWNTMLLPASVVKGGNRLSSRLSEKNPFPLARASAPYLVRERGWWGGVSGRK